MEGPLNKVVFIQKVASFAPLSLQKLIKLAYVNKVWADTIKNYGSHLIEERSRPKDASVLVFNGIDERCFWRAVKSDALWLVNALLSKSFLDRIDCLIIACEASTSTQTLKFVLDKIVEIGGSDVLKAQLLIMDSICNERSLMRICSNPLASPEMIGLIWDKSVEVGGTKMVKLQLASTGSADTSCIKLMCRAHGSSPELKAKQVMFMLGKILEFGGPELLKAQFMATDRNGDNCLTFANRNSTVSVELIKVLAHKMVEADGPELLKHSLNARILDFEATCEAGRETTGSYLAFLTTEACKGAKSGAYLIASLLHHFGLFKEQYAALREKKKKALNDRFGIDSGVWTPDPESIAEVKEIFERSKNEHAEAVAE